MRCVISTCNLDSGCATKGTTLYSIPTKPSVRALWLKLLNVEPSDLADDSAVCSKHFLKGDLYVDRTGVCSIRAGALPIVNLQSTHTSDTSNVKVCRICFATECKLYNITENSNLDRAYSIMTGLSLENEEDLPQCLCSECAQRLLNCAHFRTRSLRAHLILLEVVKKYDRITLQSIKSVVGNEGPLGSHLKVSQKDHFDLEISHNEEKNEESVARIDLADNVDLNVDIKMEKDDFSITNSEYTDNDHVGNSDDLNEQREVKMDADDSVSRDVNEEDTIRYFPQFNKGVSTDLVEGDEVEINTVKGVADGYHKDAVVYDKVESNQGEKEEKLLLIGKKPCKDSIKGREAASSNGPSRRYLRHNYRLLADKFIIKPGTVRRKVVPEDLCPTNIVKLRKRSGIEKPIKKTYDKTLYQTVGDVPLWGPLKTSSKTHSCRYCDFKTCYMKELKLHEKGHCDMQNKTLTQSDVAKYYGGKNKEMTSGCNKQYSCNICKEHFKYSFELDVHNRMHTGEKPYSCDVCNKTFNFETSLTLHTRRLHPNECSKVLTLVHLDERIKKRHSVERVKREAE